MINDDIKSYLALGDSYSIGEQVPLTDSFPYQTVQLLRNAGISFYAPEIIAKTGWTTDELQAAIGNTTLLKGYDIVTLLIGVNNQYRGRTADNFKVEFAGLLAEAIRLAGDVTNVYVLSIPDWGITPFAAGKDTAKIAVEIDEFNAICQTVSQAENVSYIEITSSQRADALNPDFLATDSLHPSGKEYAKWAKLLAKTILEKMNFTGHAI